jgi:hypothetical protein
MFAPALGIEEDPATGSTCAALAGTLADRQNFLNGTFRLSILQSVAMGRRSARRHAQVCLIRAASPARGWSAPAPALVHCITPRL